MRRSYYFPQEVEVWYILPAIRKQLALELQESGMSQKDVASLLKLTEAAVSHYKKNKRVKNDLFTPMIKNEIKRSAQHILRDPSAALSEILRISDIVRKEKVMCKMHLMKSGLTEKELPCSLCNAHR
jgi:hypothetical protein